ncbi:ABC_trans_aux domain-containing protein [Rhodovastum atsumiense]|uniref:Uncharacterized protein n=1 Tax=Rhodovastum atsumiense TaxID=504468 RepID=A0A5M6IV05_9PROT|nr:ABC-type transport auxiliary lipoprotein family protein [Rhodovastum atsumiense]KAA5611687.1 hypothetical protein F1189_12880 [Rhodovastum atsumiense]CAH2604260.1 ABC_trans_aux domain-containing protein [Rhodovastum atsumiense]
MSQAGPAHDIAPATPRRAALGLLLALAGCGLATRPYAERRQWPLRVRRPQALPPPARGPVLLIRDLAAGPGLEARGLQSIAADGSIRTEFYEEWSVPPAQAVQEAVRAWLAEAGLFQAVILSGSRLGADLVLEGELTALWTLPAQNRAHAALGLTVLRQLPVEAGLLLQTRLEADAPLAAATPQASAQAMEAAVAGLCGQVEAALRTARIR